MASTHRQFAQYVLTHRTRRGLSQRQLAELIGVTKPTISYWEAAKVLPQPTILEPLARALHGSYEDLFALTGYTHPEGLPSGGPYLRAKFPGASKRKLAEAERLYSELEADEAKRAGRAKGQRS